MKSFFLVYIISTLIIHQTALGHLLAIPEAYLVEFTPGKKWNHNVNYKRQKDISKHVFHIRKILKNEKVYISGNQKESHLEFFYIVAESEAEVRGMVEQDPSIKSLLMNYEIRKVFLTKVMPLPKNHSH